MMVRNKRKKVWLDGQTERKEIQREKGDRKTKRIVRRMKEAIPAFSSIFFYLTAAASFPLRGKDKKIGSKKKKKPLMYLRAALIALFLAHFSLPK